MVDLFTALIEFQKLLKLLKRTELLRKDRLFDDMHWKNKNQQKKSLKNCNLSLEFSKLEKILFTPMLTNNCFFLFLLLPMLNLRELHFLGR
uniref:Uncharacterized protein n=1 Tax=Meloidogyne enterolobii TaxID=390850 RepID=A0A6V7WWZ1_MELEN|nr:unnamed protein product [Meloidogyne enterolobii]